MTCIFGCDHAGLSLAKHLVKYISSFSNVGKLVEIFPAEDIQVDYPDFANLVCKEVANNKDTIGILICGSGIGMSIAANKIKGIRAALCINEYMARYARMHNDANILCLGQRIVGYGIAEIILEVFMSTKFCGDRHLLRINKITNLES